MGENRPETFTFNRDSIFGYTKRVSGDPPYGLEERPAIGKPLPAVDKLFITGGAFHEYKVPMVKGAVKRFQEVDSPGFAPCQVKDETAA
jgi:hypothetical protein